MNVAHAFVNCVMNPVCQQRGKDEQAECSADAGRLTLVVGRVVAELLDERIHLGMHHHLVLIPDAVLSQEVKLDMVTRHALHILNLHITLTQALTSSNTGATWWLPPTCNMSRKCLATWSQQSLSLDRAWVRSESTVSPVIQVQHSMTKTEMGNCHRHIDAWSV